MTDHERTVIGRQIEAMALAEPVAPDREFDRLVVELYGLTEGRPHPALSRWEREFRLVEGAMGR